GADVDVELPVDRRARDLDLVLVIDVGLLNRAATPGSGVRQRGLVDLVDVLGRRAMRLGAVVRAGLAAGPLRIGRGRPFGEGGGLPFAGPLLLFEQAGHAPDPRL